MDPSWSPTGAGAPQSFRGFCLSLAVQFLSSCLSFCYKNTKMLLCHQSGRVSADGFFFGNCRISADGFFLGIAGSVLMIFGGIAGFFYQSGRVSADVFLGIAGSVLLFFWGIAGFSLLPKLLRLRRVMWTCKAPNPRATGVIIGIISCSSLWIRL